MIDEVDHDLEHSVDDPPPPANRHQEQLSVLRQDRRGHAREHPFPRRRQVRGRPNPTVGRGQAGTRVEIAHFVVQQKPGAGCHNPRTVAFLDGVSQCDGVAVPVHHGQMVVSLPSRGQSNRSTLETDARSARMESRSAAAWVLEIN